VSYGVKDMLKDAIVTKRFNLENERRDLMNSKSQEDNALNLKVRIQEYDKLLQDINALPVCSYEHRNPAVRNI
jgi:hypothetical protein